MLDVTSQSGRIRVIVCKGGPGWAMLAGPAGERAMVEFPVVGIGIKSMASRWPAIKAIWIPMFGGHGQKVDLQMEVAKAEKVLREGEHRTPPKGYPEDRSKYGVPEFFGFPLDTEKRVRSAIAYFSKHDFLNAAQKKECARRIMAAARKYKIEVDKDDDVARAARK